MTVLGLDYSGGRPSGAAVYAAGYRFVARYLANGLAGRFNLTAAEVLDMRSHLVDVVMVWEMQANRALGGRSAGVLDAHAADTQANAVGLGGLPVYFAVDFDIPDFAPAATSPRAKLGAVADYLDGVASVLVHNRIGVYGGYYAVSRALDAGLAAWGWQTAAWSGGQTDPRIHLFQRVGTVTVGGVGCDVNEARQAVFGQNPPGDDMTPDDILDAPIQRDGGGTGATSLRAIGAWSDAHIDDTNKRIDTLAAKVDALATPTIDLDALAAKVASHIRLSGTVVADGQPAS